MTAPSARWAPIAVIRLDSRRLLSASVSVFITNPWTYFSSQIDLLSVGAECNANTFAFILFYIFHIAFTQPPACPSVSCLIRPVCCRFFCFVFLRFFLFRTSSLNLASAFPTRAAAVSAGQRRFPSTVSRDRFLHQPAFHIPIDVWSRSETFFFFFSFLSRFKRHV